MKKNVHKWVLPTCRNLGVTPVRFYSLSMKPCPDTFICFQGDYVLNIYVNAFPDYIN